MYQNGRIRSMLFLTKNRTNVLSVNLSEIQTISLNRLKP
ncbi:hypothetical protein LEP1GSC096_0935 [Leptospira interrogans serovar Hebdomadis str. R499]|uniref:Uncharacterized protein n=1 Tax=Leptospira interrogans str. UI 12758 TaxID=1049938 RepID=A0A0E2D7H3_LEPIR|nr:hypothetical protein LEP1GSC045_3028 [Leptospira interrogans serovar Pomona str. Kennewicki LC82-25]EKN98721.1 hypothetical protein LEP1GSC014_2821 [Leptospira interrogans serovar Pomona str. Pomona]EKR38230.1 hypothetical protein LEP1GSC096_0935 [Leptospira interrogans serovar Hebdomadis str. R499]EKR55970.1 hypothetical protein LEP1GSC105_3690 [Leptospira interrogans str. UI 12758]EKR83358.1 hypothetical protein LEP1GSC099_1195 [Leptospira interrogans str. UI 08452]EMF34494.1 hypothetical